MSRVKASQKLFLVFLETENGGIREVKVKAASGDAAGRRAMKRVDSAVAVRRVEQG